MISKSLRKLLMKLEKIPIYEFIAASLLISSKPVPSFVEEKKTEEQIKPIEGEEKSKEEDKESKENHAKNSH